MAHIYAGDTSKVDGEVLRAAEKLPDDFWVFAEFDIERNVDWLIMREVPLSEKGLRPSTLIITELKHSDKPIRAWNMNGTWDKLDDSGNYVEVHTDKSEVNYYQQVLHTSSALQEWLWRNQRFYLDGSSSVQPIDSFKPWPDLLIVSPPGVRHQLPIRPPSGYGGFWFGVEQWIGHVQRWNPRTGYSWSSEEIEKLADFFGLKLVQTPSVAVASAGPGTGASEIGDFMTWLMHLEQRVARLEQRLQASGTQENNGVQPTSSLGSLPASSSLLNAPQDSLYTASYLPIQEIPYAIGQQFDGVIYRISPQKDYVLASLPDGFTVLLHISKMSEGFQHKLNWEEVQIGDAVRLEVIHMERDRGQLRLEVRDLPNEVASVAPYEKTAAVSPMEDEKPVDW